MNKDGWLVSGLEYGRERMGYCDIERKSGVGVV